MDDERKKIRFIDSRYRDLFQIQDGDAIKISYPDRPPVERVCTYLDEYHTQVGSYVYHICEFAEKMEAIGATYEPVHEPAKNHVLGRHRADMTARGR